MIKQMLVPIVVLVHLGLELLYLWLSNIGYSSNRLDQMYFLADPIGFGIIILAMVFYNYTPRDKQFLIVWGIVNLFRGACYELNFLHLMNRNYNLLTVFLGIVIVTIWVLISGGRHGYFNKD